MSEEKPETVLEPVNNTKLAEDVKELRAAVFKIQAALEPPALPAPVAVPGEPERHGVIDTILDWFGIGGEDDESEN